MRYLFGLLCAVALTAVPLVGCSETTGELGGNGGDGGGGGNGGANTATASFLLTEWTPEQGTIGAAVGVRICENENGRANCVDTDDMGFASLEVPVDQEVSSTMDKDGFNRLLSSFVVSEGGSGFSLGLATEQRIKDQHDLMGSPYPMDGTGMIYIDTGTLVGVTLELIGTTGKPFYRDLDANFDPDLTATTAYGGGGFLEVIPGTYVVEIGGTAENCVITRGWPGAADNTLKLPVLEDYMSAALVVCDEVLN